MEDAKLSPLSENLKRMRLATEHTEQVFFYILVWLLV